MSQIAPPKAPSLPEPSGAYDVGFFNRLNNTLRLYFNQMDNALQQLLTGFNHYGYFYSTVNQTAAVINTAYPITMDTTQEAFGISLLTSSQIQVSRGGVYRIEATIQIDDSGGGTDYFNLWLRINGADVAYSASRTAILGTSHEALVALTYTLALAAGDYFEMVWSTDNTTVFLLAATPVAPVPALPSARISASYLFPNDAT